MNFDYTYITLFGFSVFEPGVILTNTIFFSLCIWFFKKLTLFAHPYAVNMGWFILMLGISSLFGAIAHAIHYQLGESFFKTVFFLMNGFSLFSIYFCFRGAYTLARLEKKTLGWINTLVIVWLLALLVLSFIKGDFLIIKIHAGITLIYSLVVHYLSYLRKKEQGSLIIVSGIVISFFSITVHTLKFSLDEWFNYKDIAHVIMIISLVIIYKGVRLNLLNMRARLKHREPFAAGKN